MSAQVVVVPAYDEEAIAGAVREVSRALGRGDLMLVASNLSAYDLELVRSHDQGGAPGFAPADLLASGCSTVFSARAPRMGPAAAAGRNGAARIQIPTTATSSSSSSGG